MTFIVLIVLGFGGKLSLSSRLLLHESISRPTSVDMIKFAKIIILFTFSFEIIGAILLSIYWTHSFPLSKAIYSGIFFSVSSFCTAGFGLFSDSLISYQGSIFLNLVISIICMAGGIGFFFLYDMYILFNKTFRRQRPRRLSVHTKFVLALSIIIIVICTGIIFISERGQSFPFGEKLLTSFFQSISASTTTGFNTVNIGAMSSASLFAIIALMFIGASPGGTGGGIKTISFGIMLLFLFSLLRGKEDVNLLKWRIPFETIKKVFAIGFAAIFWVTLMIAILTTTEKASFLEIFLRWYLHLELWVYQQE